MFASSYRTQVSSKELCKALGRLKFRPKFGTSAPRPVSGSALLEAPSLQFSPNLFLSYSSSPSHTACHRARTNARSNHLTRNGSCWQLSSERSARSNGLSLRDDVPARHLTDAFTGLKGRTLQCSPIKLTTTLTLTHQTVAFSI